METVLSDVTARRAPSEKMPRASLSVETTFLPAGVAPPSPRRSDAGENRVRRPEAADVVLEGGRRVLRILAGGPAIDERGDAREVLLVAGNIGRADDEYAGGEHVPSRLGEVRVLLATERY